MGNYHQDLLPGHTYHLFSRAVGSERLFLNAENYRFFLRKLKQHTAGVCRFYCYSLLPNHFHLLGLIIDEAEIESHFREVKKKEFISSEHCLSDFIMERFSNFLNSYTKSFNKSYNRKGALFLDYLKRSVVMQESDFISFVWYIHKNAAHHGLVKKIGEWKYDSYNFLISESSTSLLRDEVLEWFGGRRFFIEFHNQTIDPKIDILDTDL